MISETPTTTPKKGGFIQQPTAANIQVTGGCCGQPVNANAKTTATLTQIAMPPVVAGGCCGEPVSSDVGATGCCGEPTEKQGCCG